MINLLKSLYKKKIAISLLIILLPCTGYAGDSFTFSRPTDCSQDENKSDPCILDSFPKDVQVTLLGKRSETCKAYTDLQYKFVHEISGNEIPSTRIYLKTCNRLSGYDIAIVGNTEVTYEVLKIEEQPGVAISNKYDSRIRSKNLLKAAYQNDPYLPEPSTKPKIYRFPYPSTEIIMAKYKNNGAEHNIFVFPDKEFVLDQICIDEIRAFKLNNRYFLLVDYRGCDSGLCGIDIYEINSKGIIKVFSDSSFST